MADEVEPTAEDAQPVDVPELRTADSHTFDNGDGSFTTELFAEPVYYQPPASAEWLPTTNIDPDGRRWLRDLMGAGGGGGGGVLFGGYLLLKGFFTWVWRLVGPAGRAVVPTWVRSGTTVASWAKVLETLWRSSRVMPTAPTVQRLIDLARKYGLKVECNKGHWGTPWWFRHLHIGDQRFHVPVPPGMDLPFPCR